MSVLLSCVIFLNVVAINLANIPISEESLQELMVNDDRIVGGTEADIIHHPYQVALNINDARCGGFIVSEQWILTAAHCVFNAKPSRVMVTAGSPWMEDGEKIPIAEIITHPEYNQTANDMDVAAMKTYSPIKFSDNIKPIKVAPQGRRMRPRSYFVVCGWGRTEEAEYSDRLMSVDTRVVWYPKCYSSYRQRLTRNMWCGGNYLMGGEGPCQGDSGGTAVQDGMAVGIVSFGRECGQRLSPVVFADISAPAIRLFITKHTGL